MSGLAQRRVVIDAAWLRAADSVRPPGVARRENYDGQMLRLLSKSGPLKRLSHGVPIGAVLLAGQVLVIAWSHIAKLDGAQRRRLVALLAQSKGRPGSLSKSEREELAGLFAILEPRLFLGSAAKRLSPVPMPQRLLYGPRGSSARAAASRRR